MIKAIYTSKSSGSSMESHLEIEAIEGKGLSGDRYETGRGFYSGQPEWDAHLTLIQIEPFKRLRSEHGLVMDPIELRRNLVVESIDLEFLINKRFKIGNEVTLETRKLWPPCSHIVKRSGRNEIFEYLAKSTGIGVSVVKGGTIKIGDPIYPIKTNAEQL